MFSEIIIAVCDLHANPGICTTETSAIVREMEQSGAGELDVLDYLAANARALYGDEPTYQPLVRSAEPNIDYPEGFDPNIPFIPDPSHGLALIKKGVELASDGSTEGLEDTWTCEGDTCTLTSQRIRRGGSGGSGGRNTGSYYNPYSSTGREPEPVELPIPDISIEDIEVEICLQVDPNDQNTATLMSQVNFSTSGPSFEDVKSAPWRYPSGGMAFAMKLIAERHTMHHFGNNDRDNDADGFRHVMWSYLMSQGMGTENAKFIGDANERRPGNSPGSRAMDLYNNATGRALFKAYGYTRPADLAPIIKKMMEDGIIVVAPSGESCEE